MNCILINRGVKDSDLSTHSPAQHTGTQPSTDSQASSQQASVMDAIDQMFAEFQLVYNNQYHKAFPTTDKLQYAKRLWYNFLKDYSAEQVLHACHRAIKESEFLPTVKGILKYIGNDYSEHGLPEPRQAYIEACRAPSPKQTFNWSHPAVYYAGQQSDWFFLASNSEQVAFPVFDKHYRQLCEAVIKGRALTMPGYDALPQEIHQPMSKAEGLKALQKLRQETGF